jgi:hypothetical protein
MRALKYKKMSVVAQIEGVRLNSRSRGSYGNECTVGNIAFCIITSLYLLALG